MNSQNDLLKIPYEELLKRNLKEASRKLGELSSEIEDLKYKNSVLIKKGRELERKLHDLANSNEFKKELSKEIKKEEMYNALKNQNKKLIDENRKLKNDNKELIYKLHNK